jgi:tetratricopeptide (TPR) repeat protein
MSIKSHAIGDHMRVESEEAGLAAEAQQHLEQACTYEEEGKLEEALRQCELAIELTPNLADAYNLRGSNRCCYVLLR